MIKEYLENSLKDISAQREKIKKEYQKNRQLEVILKEKIEKVKQEQEEDFLMFFPRNMEDNKKNQWNRLREEKNRLNQKITLLESEEKDLIKKEEEFREMMRELLELEKKAMFHVKH